MGGVSPCAATERSRAACLVPQVLTTYSTIESEYRRTMLPAKCACEYCGKKFFPDRLKVHLRFFCGPFAKKVSKRPPPSCLPDTHAQVLRSASTCASCS